MTNEEFRLQAIEALVPKGSTFHYHSSGKKRETYTLVFDPSKESDPTNSEIDAEVIRLQAAEPIRLLRIERNQKLAETDWMANKDVTLTTAWKTYRQELRDLTTGLDTVEKVNAVTWPTRPE